MRRFSGNVAHGFFLRLQLSYTKSGVTEGLGTVRRFASHASHREEFQVGFPIFGVHGFPPPGSVRLGEGPVVTTVRKVKACDKIIVPRSRCPVPQRPEHLEFRVSCSAYVRLNLTVHPET